MNIEEIKIVNHNLILPKQLSKRLKWKFPFYSIPQLKDYSQRIIELSKKNNKLPFYTKFDINNDGKEEIILIQTSLFDKLGRILIISNLNGKLKFDTVRWKRPVNALFCDYLIVSDKESKRPKFDVDRVFLIVNLKFDKQLIFFL